jgi:hypothetical protein
MLVEENSMSSGGCLCGSVRYAFEGRPKFTGVCHCAHCQKQSGSAFSVNLGVSEAKLTVMGEVAEYHDAAESGATLFRRFCARCGSPLFSVSSSAPGLVYIKAGTLDDTSTVQPGMHVWTASKQAWVGIEADALQFQQQPSAG